MSIRIALRHHTEYHYDRSIQVFPQTIRLRPAPHNRTPVVSYSLKVEPENHFINWHQDPFGNYCARVAFPELTQKLIIDVEVILDLISFNPFDFFLEDFATKYPFVYPDQLLKELHPYLEIVDNGPRLTALFKACQQYTDDHTINFLVNCNQHVQELIQYVIRFEPGVQSCETTLELANGSCRDSAWLLVQLFRHFGLASRFVSGYLVQLKPDHQDLEGPNGPEHDFTDLHAWAEVFLPGAGWVGLDATSGLLAGEGHIPLACTPDPVSAAPISGFTEPCESRMEYANNIDRIYESPRVTKPYTQSQIEHIQTLGLAIDQKLAQTGLQLTMGGEPTFVSREDMESAQWNDAADGEDKRKRAFQLALGLKTAFAPKGLLHLGQGKWYPGEPIPRWQYATYWRKDGRPIWQNPELFSNPNTSGSFTLEDVATFADLVNRYLGFSESMIIPAFEDLYYYAWENNNLPVNQELKEVNKDQSAARRTMAELYENGIDQPVGYIIPIHWDFDQQTWISQKWQFRNRTLFLVPGNSDIGYRLPLDRLPVTSDQISSSLLPPDPLSKSPDLPEHSYFQHLIEQRLNAANSRTPQLSPTIKTAMCFQIKRGNIIVFLPPIQLIEPFLDLITVLETAANQLNITIQIEGYQPPPDQRIEKLVVAPDPGVIEVNIHPARTWQEINDNYSILFEETKKVKLDAQKFMIDGRHIGTGGGNHITLGGPTPSESPILVQPDLLKSIIGFWNNHPGLSYLFSSPFVGMTSQSPRIDEGKPSAVYDLEIAFKELDKYDQPPFWIIDRLFRNLLTDITGNTHRAEICIDKLYNPDSQSGRLGIVELRGFDMAPHQEMCLVQLLLIRSLFTAFAIDPYREPLIKWGNQLHDKFMIHQFVRRDMEEVIHYLNRHDIPFAMEWLDPFFEFRFPILGQRQVDGVKLEIRTGIEPWNVLGEEMSSSGTARFVDSSMERIQVKVDQFNPERYWLLCNRQIVPLTATRIDGQYVAGIRYKAWAPPSALHPTIGIDTPLQFDVYDKWNNRSIGGCTYHVVHPGGRNFETFPVNIFEAEGRRVARFQEEDHSPGRVVSIQSQSDQSSNRFIRPVDNLKDNVQPIPAKVNPVFQITLDLQLGK